MPRRLSYALCAFWGLVWLGAAAGLAFGIRALQPGESISGFDALLRGVLAGKDTLDHDFPAAWQGWRWLRQSGAFALWNPSWFGGQPFIAAQTWLPFYPANWLMGLLPFPLAFNLQYPLHLLIAAATMAWSCRRRGLGWAACGVAGLIWGFGGCLATLAGPGHLQLLQALAWMPLVVYGAGALAGPDPRRGILPLAAGLSLQTLAGHPQAVYLSLIAGGAEFIVRILEIGLRRIRPPALADRDRASVSPSFFRIARCAFVALLLSLLLPAVLWVPTAEFGRISNRADALGWDDAVRGSLPPEEAFEFALPRLTGDTMPHGRGAYAGRFGESPTSSPERTVSDYAGAGTLCLALLALFIGEPRRRLIAAGWLALGAFGLVLALGGYLGGVYSIMLNVIPGLEHLRAPSRMAALTCFGLAMAAAIGLDGLLAIGKLDEPRRKRQATGVAIAAALVLALGYFLRIMAFGDMLAGGAGWERLHARPADLAHALIALRSIAIVHLTIFLSIAAAAIAGIALCGRSADRVWPGRLIPFFFALFAVSLAADLTINDAPFWNAVEAAPYEEYMQTSWAMPAWDAKAAQLRGPSRIFEPGSELKNWALTYTDFSRGRVVSSLHGYHPVAESEYFFILAKLGFLHPNLLKLFAVDWLLWSDAGAGGAPRPPGYAEVMKNGDELLLHNPEIQFVHDAGPIYAFPDRDALVAWLRDVKNDPQRETAVLAGETVAGANDSQPAPMRLKTKIWPLGPGEWRIDYQAAAAGRIVVAIPATPGWRAEWNQGDLSKNLPIARADGYMQLIGPVPQGAASIWLRYDPASQRLGLYLTLLGIAWLGWIAARVRWIR